MEGSDMTVALRTGKDWTADAFVATDQHVFGNDWRYELVEGQVVGHAAPSPEHGAILIGLSAALFNRRDRLPAGCRPESGSAATPSSLQRNTARIPDAMIRCGAFPRVAFEVVSPSEIRDWRGRDLKRKHLQAVEGIEAIVELFQDDFAAHVYRLSPTGTWEFEALGGPDALLSLDMVQISIPLSEIYELADLPRESSQMDHITLRTDPSP
jgi:Uma2 family endonuclease